MGKDEFISNSALSQTAQNPQHVFLSIKLLPCHFATERSQSLIKVNKAPNASLCNDPTSVDDSEAKPQRRNRSRRRRVRLPQERQPGNHGNFRLSFT